MTVDVTIISCLYGNSHDDYLGDWLAAVKRLDPAPREVIIATDRYRHLTDGVLEVFRRRNGWTYPQAFFLNAALAEVQTDWIWILDIDDVAYPDALSDIDEGTADVFQMGFLRSDGETHVPSPLDLLQLDERNGLVAGSMVRTEAIRGVGGFRDVALQDWDLWSRLAEAGAFFAFSDRPRFLYRRHANTRGARELTMAERTRHMAEMEAA